MAEHVCRTNGAKRMMAARNCVSCLRNAVSYATNEMFYSSRHGGLSKEACQIVHDELVERIPDVHQ